MPRPISAASTYLITAVDFVPLQQSGCGSRISTATCGCDCWRGNAARHNHSRCIGFAEFVISIKFGAFTGMAKFSAERRGFSVVPLWGFRTLPIDFASASGQK